MVIFMAGGYAHATRQVELHGDLLKDKKAFLLSLTCKRSVCCWVGRAP